MVRRSQQRLPGLAAGSLHQRLPEADGLPQDGDRLGRSTAVVQHVGPASPIASRQLKRGIELRGVAEALDEGLELLHRALRIALGEERPGVLPLVGGGFFREALLGHRVLQPLHPGIAFAEAAGPFQIVAKRVAQRRGGLELPIGHGPADGGAVVRLLAVQDFQRGARLGARQRLVQRLHEGDDRRR